MECVQATLNATQVAHSTHYLFAQASHAHPQPNANGIRVSVVSAQTAESAPRLKQPSNLAVRGQDASQKWSALATSLASMASVVKTLSVAHLLPINQLRIGVKESSVLKQLTA